MWRNGRRAYDRLADFFSGTNILIPAVIRDWRGFALEGESQMSIANLAVVSCDHIHTGSSGNLACYGEFQTTTDDPGEARRQALEAGWEYRQDSGQDICAGCISLGA